MSERFERAGEEVVEEEFERVEEASEEVVADDVEVVESDVEVVAKPRFAVSDYERWLAAIYRLRAISRRIEELERAVEAYHAVLRLCGLRYDARKLRRRIGELSAELRRLRRERSRCRVEIYLNCELRRMRSRACANCWLRRECAAARSLLKRRRAPRRV